MRDCINCSLKELCPLYKELYSGYPPRISKHKTESKQALGINEFSDPNCVQISMDDIVSSKQM